MQTFSQPTFQQYLSTDSSWIVQQHVSRIAQQCWPQQQGQLAEPVAAAISPDPSVISGITSSSACGSWAVVTLAVTAHMVTTERTIQRPMKNLRGWMMMVIRRTPFR
jgi:hypothetical protein